MIPTFGGQKREDSRAGVGVGFAQCIEVGTAFGLAIRPGRGGRRGRLVRAQMDDDPQRLVGSEVQGRLDLGVKQRVGTVGGMKEILAELLSADSVVTL